MDPNATATPAASATQDTPSQATPDAGGSTSSGGSQATPAEPFLKVNDRQSYASREEAIRAYDEAGKRISQLSPWESLAKEGFTVEQVQGYLDELARLRAQASQTQQPAGGQPGQPTQQPPAKPPEWVEYLQKAGIFPTAEQFKSLQDQIAAVGQNQQGEHAARLEAARSSGEQILNGIVKDSGLTLNEPDSLALANAIEDQIVRASRDERGNIIPNSPEDRFIRGDASERASIIKEQFAFFTRFGDGYSKVQTSKLVDQKTAAHAANASSLPPAGSSVPTPAAPGKGFKDPNLNARVAAAFEEANRRHAGVTG